MDNNRNDLDDSTDSRMITNAIRNSKAEPAPLANQAVYGDTDLNPNADDQKSAHAGAEPPKQETSQ
ncbi:MAG: hypothetical protein NVSMB31_15480 [Vulcanimicrobiaceae bacterium]